jgi:hypothetical protein
MLWQKGMELDVAIPEKMTAAISTLEQRAGREQPCAVADRRRGRRLERDGNDNDITVHRDDDFAHWGLLAR